MPQVTYGRIGCNSNNGALTMATSAPQGNSENLLPKIGETPPVLKVDSGIHFIGN